MELPWVHLGPTPPGGVEELSTTLKVCPYRIKSPMGLLFLFSKIIIEDNPVVISCTVEHQSPFLLALTKKGPFMGWRKLFAVLRGSV